MVATKQANNKTFLVKGSRTDMLRTQRRDKLLATCYGRALIHALSGMGDILGPVDQQDEMRTAERTSSGLIWQGLAFSCEELNGGIDGVVVVQVFVVSWSLDWVFFGPEDQSEHAFNWRDRIGNEKLSLMESKEKTDMCFSHLPGSPSQKS